MRPQLSKLFASCKIWYQHDATMKTPSIFGWLLLIVVTLLLLAPVTAIGKKGSGGKGGGPDTSPDLVDYGDVFGDLMHILRDETTGQPIFAQRWVEMPAELPGYGWGYCAIGIDANGVEIPFAPYSCEIDADFSDDVVEVDYFGRLNASRVQERNQRMHFNETITNIKQAARLRLDPTGRLSLGFVDPDALEGDPVCALEDNEELCLWTTVDSPMENMALYQRMMKYGHIATDPEEEDLWWHGDPKLPTPFHPALGPDDFAKFVAAGLSNWLPDGEVWDADGNFTREDYPECFNGPKEIVPCLPPEELTREDFNTSAELLGAAGGKHNFFTVHLVQYLNRFLRITQRTVFAEATLNSLPAKYLSCDYLIDDVPQTGDPWTSGGEPPEGWDMEVDLTYENCIELEVDDGIPNYSDFSNVQERFMDFALSSYQRNGNGGVWTERYATVALEATLYIPSENPLSKTPRIQDEGGPRVESTPGAMSDIWLTIDEEPLLNWIELVNQDYSPTNTNIHNFVDAASDALRAIEFFHNYQIPENLYCTYLPEIYCPPPPLVTNE